MALIDAVWSEVYTMNNTGKSYWANLTMYNINGVTEPETKQSLFIMCGRLGNYIVSVSTFVGQHKTSIHVSVFVFFSPDVEEKMTTFPLV